MSRNLTAIFAAALFALSAQAAPTPGVTVTGPAFDAGDGPWSMGFAFRANSDIVVTQLGAFDLDGDGFLNDHPVGLWTAGGSLLASTTATSAGTLVDAFRYAELASGVTLHAGQVYVVGAGDFGGDFISGPQDTYIMSGTVTAASQITYLGTRFVDGDGLLFPSLAPTNNTSYYGANFLFEGQSVPEPGSLALVGLAAAAAAAAARRRSA